jgi:meso-butanediol dehydrogenase / (S,S)-butanediol dehydrogenase / diacetyl reductase
MAGKVIVITGANGGLGRALAKRFSADGEQLVLLGRTLSRVQALADEIGDRALAVECRVCTPESVRSAFATIAKTHPTIDVLINCAAVYRPYLLEEATDEQIRDTLMTNLGGPMMTSRAAIPMLRRGGHIINVSSESVELALPHQCGYQATKSGLERLSRALSLELEDKGIRVTAVRAGQMAGPETASQVDDEAGMRFFEAAMKRGINLMAKPISSFHSATYAFRWIIDSPPDLTVGLVTLEARNDQ